MVDAYARAAEDRTRLIGVPWSASPRRRAGVAAPRHSLIRLVDAGLSLAIRGPEQIPAVAADVKENRDAPVSLGARCRYELDAGAPHTLKRGVEVVDAQEESDPARELLSHRRRLGVAVRVSEEQAGARSRRPYDDPPFRPTVVGDRGRVLDEFKPERTNEELDRATVVLDDQRNQLEVHAAPG